MKKLIAAVAAVAALLLPYNHTTAADSDYPVKSELNLEDERTVVLKGTVTSRRVDPLVNELVELDKELGKPINLVINSPGGSISAGFRLASTMEALDNKLVCLVDTKAYSMAAILTQYCDETWASKYASIMFHQASLRIGGQEPAFKSRAQHFVKHMNELHRFVAEKLGLEYKDYRAKIRDEWWLTATEAVDAGVVTGLVEGFKYKYEEEQPLFFLFMNNQEYSLMMCGPTPNEKSPCYGRYRETFEVK